MEKVQNTTQTTKEFNKSYDSMVALGMVTEEKLYNQQLKRD